MTTTQTISADTKPDWIGESVLNALVVVEGAKMFGLPLPFAVTAFDYTGVSIIVHTYEDITAWSTYLDEPITSFAMDGGQAHHEATGVIAGVTVTVACVVPA